MKSLTRLAVAVLSLTAVLSFAGTAVANAKPPAPGSYTARTENGGKFKFKLSGRKVAGITGVVPAICLETTGSYQTRAGGELFNPPGSFGLDRTGKVKVLQPAAMNRGTKATKNYTVTMKPAGSKVKCKVKLSYSFLTPGYDIYHSYIWICSSSVKFTATKS